MANRTTGLDAGTQDAVNLLWSILQARPTTVDPTIGDIWLMSAVAHLAGYPRVDRASEVYPMGKPHRGGHV